MSSTEFTLAARLRLFLTPSNALPLVCSCPFLLAARLASFSPHPSFLADPAHFLSCPILKDLRRVRHDRLVRLLSSLVHQVGGVCQIEPSHFPTARPDLLVFMFDSSFLLDLVVSHPSAPSHLSRSPVPLVCNRYAESRKFTHYSSILSSSFQIVPFALESFGAFGSCATSFIGRLDALSRQHLSTSLPTPPVLPSISILLQKCNAYILSRGVVLVRSSSASSLSAISSSSLSAILSSSHLNILILALEGAV